MAAVFSNLSAWRHRVFGPYSCNSRQCLLLLSNAYTIAAVSPYGLRRLCCHPLARFFIVMTEREKVNFVHQDKIHIEMIKKEERLLKLHTEFSINPFRKLHIMADKPMSKKPLEMIAETADFREAFHKAHMEPTKKYPVPLTESQEIGWFSTLLTPLSHHDNGFNFHRITTDVTFHGKHA
ncbi:protein FAM183A [Melanotaenia boesemani]|uniref:protein FAM183A n=1 Tax=Melanotaenia boesemani TaxID=1250792 RepID=UPI001C050CA8|nr:protein FAM183A [Melanotaenia boesemani]